MDLQRTLDRINRKSVESFQAKHIILSFQEYLDLLVQRPYSLTRNAAQYLKDLMEHWGVYEVPGIQGPVRRFHLFDDPEGDGAARVFGQEEVQNHLYEILSGFAERGRSDRFILLHGPNGSAKSSLVDALRLGLERYSRHDDGPLFRFSWIFCEAGEKGPLGFGQANEVERLDSLADVDDRLISSRLPCEIKDPPFFLLPKRRRLEILSEAQKEAPESESARFRWTEFVTRGELSPKNKAIYESLLRSYRGDWRKTIRHIRVERFYISHRYRVGAVTIEPQGTIDAGSRSLGHGPLSGIPPVVAHEDLVEGHGDLIDANCGIVEYSDFLKRNLEANKYLLTTAERGFLNLPSLTVALNLVLCGTTNEKYLAAFKRDPSWPSFKGRFALLRVPYLREFPKEAQIYERHLRAVAGGRHVAPHLAAMTGLWAVLSRLKRPDPTHYEGPTARVVKRLTPMDKARLYATGELPLGLSDEEQKQLRAAVPALAGECDNTEEEFEEYVESAYEGRRGASPREMQSLLTEIAVESSEPCLTPVEFFEALPRLIADPSIYPWLRVEKDGEYCDPEGFIDVVRAEYLRELSREVQRATDLVDEGEYARLFTEYMRQVRAWATGEKVAHPQTGQARDPDRKLMAEVEGHLGVQGGVEDFRRSLITKIAAWRLSNPEATIDYESLFRDHFWALKRSFFAERRDRILAIVKDALAMLSGGAPQMAADRVEAARHLLGRLVQDFGYCEGCVGRILGYFHRHGSEIDS